MLNIHRVVSTVVLGLAVQAGVEAVHAGPNANAKIQVHILGTAEPLCVDGSITYQPSCDRIRTAASLYPPRFYYAYVLVTDGNATEGVGALSFGIDYDAMVGQGVELWAWVSCSVFEQPVSGVNGPWPSAQSGNSISWGAARCQNYEPGGNGTGVTAAAGYFYCGAYTADILSIVVHPSNGLATVSSCAAVVDTVEGGGVVRTPSHLGRVRFSPGGSEPGYSPCGLNTPVVNSTWGRIKSINR